MDNTDPIRVTVGERTLVIHPSAAQAASIFPPADHGGTSENALRAIWAYASVPGTRAHFFQHDVLMALHDVRIRLIPGVLDAMACLAVLHVETPGIIAALDASPLGTLSGLDGTELPLAVNVVLMIDVICMMSGAPELRAVVETCRLLVNVFSLPALQRCVVAVVLTLDQAWLDAEMGHSALENVGFTRTAVPQLMTLLTPMGKLLVRLAQPAIDAIEGANPNAMLIAQQPRGVPVRKEFTQLSTWLPPTGAQHWSVPPRTFLTTLPAYIYAVACGHFGALASFLTSWKKLARTGHFVDVGELLNAALTNTYTKGVPPSPDIVSAWFGLSVSVKRFLDEATRRAYAVLVIKVDKLPEARLRDEPLSLERATLVPAARIGDPLCVTAAAFGLYAGVTALQQMIYAICVATDAAGTLVRRIELESLMRDHETGLDTGLYENVSTAVSRLDAHFGAGDWSEDARRHADDTESGLHAVEVIPPPARSHGARALLVRKLVPREVSLVQPNVFGL